MENKMDLNQLIDSVLQKIAENKIVEDKDNDIINKSIKPKSIKLIKNSNFSENKSCNDLISSFSLNYNIKVKSLNKTIKQSPVWNHYNLFPAKFIFGSNKHLISKRKLKNLKILPTITEENYADIENECLSTNGDSACKEVFAAQT